MSNEFDDDVRNKLGVYGSLFSEIEIEAITALRAVLVHADATQSVRARAASDLARIIGSKKSQH